MNPVTTAILAWVLLGQALSTTQILAGLLVLLGIFVSWYYSPRS